MSGAISQTATNPNLFASSAGPSWRNPVLQDLEDTGRALRLCDDPLAAAALGRAVDSVSGLEGAGIVCRVDRGTAAPRVKTLRLPRSPGDITVCTMFGNPVPAPGTPGSNHHLRNELLAGGLSCGAALFGWIGFVGSAALAAPTAGLSVAGMIYDGLAASAASISCINSGVRILNEARGNHQVNERLDRNSAYQRTMLGLDVFGAGGVYRGGADGVRAVRALGSAASAVSGSSAATAIVRVIALDREIKVRLVNALGAAVTLISSNDAGALGELEKGLGIPFTIVLTN
jgi:hypothetical protein